MIKTGNVGLTAVLALSLVSVSFYISAKEFITIIGPDGRPLVVPRNNAEKKTEDKSRLSKTAGTAAVQSTPVKQNLEKVPVVENGQVKPKHGHNIVVQPVQPHIAQAQIESTPQLIPESKAPQISYA